MKSQYLLSLSMPITVILMTLLAGKSATAKDAVFHCQANAETPMTVARTSNGAEQTIFHWKLDTNSIADTPQELCNSVTQKLNNYISAGNDLSSLVFQASNDYDEDFFPLPKVCVAGENATCKLPLFTLKPSDNPKVASIVLDSILDPALQTNPVKPKSRDRGFQSTSYKVNFWDLLGF